eukprot:scaffold373_cov350-Pavlova_lutheri.AAC.15
MHGRGATRKGTYRQEGANCAVTGPLGVHGIECAARIHLTWRSGVYHIENISVHFQYNSHAWFISHSKPPMIWFTWESRTPLYIVYGGDFFMYSMKIPHVYATYNIFTGFGGSHQDGKGLILGKVKAPCRVSTNRGRKIVLCLSNRNIHPALWLISHRHLKHDQTRYMCS